MICEKCGIENDDNNYCINCGNQLIYNYNKDKYQDVLDEMKANDFYVKKKETLYNGHTLEEYRKRKVVPTRLQYEDHYPTNTKYETPSSIKFIRDFYDKKKKGYKDVCRKYR